MDRAHTEERQHRSMGCTSKWAKPKTVPRLPTRIPSPNPSPNRNQSPIRSSPNPIPSRASPNRRASPSHHATHSSDSHAKPYCWTRWYGLQTWPCVYYRWIAARQRSATGRRRLAHDSSPSKNGCLLGMSQLSKRKLRLRSDPCCFHYQKKTDAIPATYCASCGPPKTRDALLQNCANLHNRRAGLHRTHDRRSRLLNNRRGSRRIRHGSCHHILRHERNRRRRGILHRQRACLRRLQRDHRRAEQMRRLTG